MTNPDTTPRSRLSAEGLAKRYRAREVVKQVSLHIDSGDVVGLLGPNGAGKAPSFYIIVGLVPCDAGSITLDGPAITREPIHQRARLGIGYLPQEASVFRKLSVEDNILGILETRAGLSRQQREEKLEALLEELHIAHIRANLGMSLSGGERRRVEIARALAMEPRFILLDEPFAGVDPISVLDIQGIVNHLRDRGSGVLITDHNVRETLDIVDRAYILHDGLVLMEGAPAEIVAHEDVRRVYLGERFSL